MNAHVTNDTLIIGLEGRMDAASSPAVEKELAALIDAHPGLPLCLDADQLTYISSSGLRVIMSLRMRFPALRIQNVSTDLYNIFEMTGMTGLMDIWRKPREISVEGCAVIGRGAFGTVYRLDEDTVVKVYPGSDRFLPMIYEEQKRARQAFLYGVPTAIPFDIVRVGDKYGAVFEMVKAQSCMDLLRENPSRFEEIIRRYVGLLNRLHSLTAFPGQLPAARERCLRRIDSVASVLPPDVTGRLRELVRAMPENLHLIHGDIHLKNVMATGDDLILIDMDTECTGDPVFEFAALFTTYIAFTEDAPENAQAFHGISAGTCERIYRETLSLSLGQPGEEALRTAEDKVRTLGYLRFLEVLMVEQAEDRSELKAKRIRTAVTHLTELAARVTSLALSEG